MKITRDEDEKSVYPSESLKKKKKKKLFAYTAFFVLKTFFTLFLVQPIYSHLSELKNNLLQAAFSGLPLVPLSSTMVVGSYIPTALSYNEIFNLLSFLLSSIVRISLLSYSYYPTGCLPCTWYLRNSCEKHERK